MNEASKDVVLEAMKLITVLLSELAGYQEDHSHWTDQSDDKICYN